MNTNIPSAVLKQGELSDQIIATLGNTTPAAEAVIEPETTPETEGGNLDESITSGIESQSTTELNPVVSAQVEPEQIPTAPQEGTVEYWKGQAQSWEHKYEIIAGKYNKEIEQQKHHFFSAKPELDRLTAKNAELEGTVQKLTSQLAEMPKEQPPQPVSVFESPEMKERLEQIAEAYGDDLANGMRMLIETGVNNASTAASTQINDLSQKVTTVESQVQDVKQTATVTTQQQAQAQAFQAKLASLSQELSAIGIDFQKVEHDPLFGEWLDKYDSETGAKRRDLMLAMLGANEIKSVAGMYVQYIEQAGNAIKETIEPQAPAPQAPQAHPQLNPQEQVQVETKAPVGREVPLQTPIWTSEAITQFYQDVATGRKYSREQAERIEQEIFAQNSGR